MKVKFPSVEKYIQEDDVVVGSNKQSKEYINIPELMSKHGNGLVSTLKMRAPVIPKMAGCMKESLKSASSVVNNPRAGKTIISKEELSELETYIKSMEIDKIGYTKVSADLVFSNHQILYGHAIVIIMEMKKEEMATAPSKDALKEVFRTYYNLGVTVIK